MLQIHFAFRDWLYSLVVGFCVVSYWRGSWTLLDHVGCDQPSDATLARGDTFCLALLAATPTVSDKHREAADLRLRNATLSYTLGICLLFVGVMMIWNGYWLPNPKTLKVTISLGITRWIIVYILGASAVCLWRGIWYWTDAWIMPDHPLASYWLTSLGGAGVAFGVCCGNSLLAPPAMFLLDGPDTDAPPIAVTALGSHYSVTLPSGQARPRLPIYVDMLDLIFSFGGIPFAVVWFWRGSWLLLDYYLWGLTDSNRDVRFSILWSMILFGISIWLTSEPIVAILDRRAGESRFWLGIVGRLRTYVLAWGTVSLWRGFWLLWDEFLGGTTLWSATLAHALPLLILTTMGCVSSICAPASTLGVDSIPHPECDDEPLFSMVPLPWEILYAFGMFRQVDKSKVDHAKCADLITAGALRGRAASTGDIEMTYERRAGAVESSASDEASAHDDDEDDDGKIEPPAKASAARRAESERSWTQSWRPGLRRMQQGGSSFLDLTKSGLRLRSCTLYAQRPNAENMRSRSRLFRSR